MGWRQGRYGGWEFGLGGENGVMAKNFRMSPTD